MQPGKSRVVRFGVFELDLASEELRKNGVRVKLTEQPFQVLVTLLERPGELIKRDELRQKLWADDTFVDFDHSLNAAINKLREALGDSAGNPRFVETVPRRGYRFIAPVEGAVGPGGREESEGAGSAATVASEASEASGGAPWKPSRMVVAVQSVLLIAAVGFILARWIGEPETAAELPLRRFTIEPDNLVTGTDARPAISPDGKHIAYVVQDGNQTKLEVYDLDRGQSRQLEDTEGGRAPCWSPDSDFIAFVADSNLKKIGADGGPAITLSRLGSPWRPQGTWSPDGESVLIADSLVYEVPATGGELIVVLDDERGRGLLYPHSLPSEAGRTRLLFSGALENRIILRDLTTGQREILATGAFPVYSASGHIVYQTRLRGDGLWALPFSLEMLEPAGEAFPIAQDAWFPSIAADGTLVYVEQPQVLDRQLVWRDRAGRKLRSIGLPQQDLEFPSLSPDGRYILVVAEENENQDIWLHDAVRSTTTRLTFHPASERGAIWSPNGKEVAFNTRRAGNVDIFITSASGGGSARPLTATRRIYEEVNDWSPDGRTLIYQSFGPKTNTDLWYVELRENATSSEAVLYLQTPALEHQAKFSIDGRYVAYVSNEAGRDEVYIRPFPEADEGQWQISQDGGIQPRWSRDGKELFYVEGETLIAVSVSTEPTFEAGSATRLFSDPHLALKGRVRPQYDVSADGQRFVMLETVGERPKPVIRVVQNWFAEFRDQ